MALFERRRRPALPAEVRAAVPLESGERLLAWARDEVSGAHVVATTHHLALVDAGGGLVWSRPWHEAESGTWQGESSQLTVTWVDRGAPHGARRDPSGPRQRRPARADHPGQGCRPQRPARGPGGGATDGPTALRGGSVRAVAAGSAPSRKPADGEPATPI